MSLKIVANRWVSLLVDLLLLALVFVGIDFRFNWVNWSQGANLHPDEYGLTNTLTQLSIPQSLGDYFNTRLSPLSPYDKYDLSGQKIQNGADNGMRWGQWPITIIRVLGELTGNTGYNEIRLMGRSLSALADTLAILLLFLIGQRLYSSRVGLLAAALSALAVLQIQQSHFMTVDNFAVFFTALTMYAAVRIAQIPGLARREWASAPEYRPARAAWKWYALFGVAFGMTLASRVNLLPLGGMLLIAAFISVADLRLHSARDLRRIALFVGLFLVFSGLVTLLTFRVTQPMTFRAASGDTTILTVHLNQDWLNTMQAAQQESNGIGGGPPQEQWANRPAILFPLANMLLWGLGLPLGVAAWLAVLWAAWRVLHGREWRAHLLPLVWVGGYFLFMGTRWVKSIRYFLPIYPFLCLLAAWGLVELWRRQRDRLLAREEASPARKAHGTAGFALPALLSGVVLLGTLAWAVAFVRAVYLTDHTRVQATEWIYQNIPAPFDLSVSAGGGLQFVPVGAPDGELIAPGQPFMQPFTANAGGTLAQVSLPHAAAPAGATSGGVLTVSIARDPSGNDVLDSASVPVGLLGSDGQAPPAAASFHGAALQAGATYYLIASVETQPVQVFRTVLSNETWDEGLPFPFEGYDPFGQLYRGVDMQVRWYDDQKKRDMFLQTLDEADYVIVPSQRAIWAVCRIPLTYPMTMEYYRALFDGSLGFDLVASFSSPLQLGPLEISDLGGTLAWEKTPALPLFNTSGLAAEEAFSVYDHPPVWIFKKRADYDPAKVAAILDAVDLSKVVIQAPKDATMLPISQP